MIKRKQLQTFWLCMVLLVVSGVAMAQAPATSHSFTLQQAVDFAKKNNVQVKNALLSLQIQEQQNRGITAAAYPQLNGNVANTYFPDIAVQSFPNFISQATYGVLTHEGVKNGSGAPIQSPTDFGIVAAQFGTKYTASAGVTLSQILFDGQVFIGLKARQTSMDFQQQNIEVTTQTIKANVYKVYYQLVVAKTQITLIDANIARLDKLQHDTKELYKNGFAEKLDVDKISVQTANLQTQKLSVLNNIEIGYLGLKTLIGMPISDALVLTDTLGEAQIKDGILQDAAYNYTDRHEYQYLQLNRKLNEFNIRRYKMAYLPGLSLAGNYSKQAQRNTYSFFQKGDWYASSYIGLNLNVPLFDGFSKDAKIKQARLEMQQTDNNIDNLKHTIDNEVQQATFNFKTAIATMDFQKQNMKLAETVYDQTRKKYEAGTGSNTEITAAQTDLITAQTNYINALYNAIVAKVDYSKAVGKL
ncbi:TolC family protein [Parasediminibacterium sp. JCM 36343]|uniref:TolC family protein n=1 Tax=Parasediminibacterium sp. JCM 36343 TaxID=3374279 RepID=UPI00397B7383